MSLPLPKSLLAYLRDPDISVLIFTLTFVSLTIAVLGHMLAPVLVAIALAYLLQWPIHGLQSLRVPRGVAVGLVYCFFLSALALCIFVLMPLLWEQLARLLAELPNMVMQGQQLLMALPDQYPNFISPEQLSSWLVDAKLEMIKVGQLILSLSVSSISGVVMFAVYCVLVPMLVYFFLTDTPVLMHYLSAHLPKQRTLLRTVWKEVYVQVGNYVRGKALEMTIVSAVFYLFFALYHLPYAFLMAVCVGLSVIVPYVGVIIVSIPVALIALFAWGLTPHFFYFLGIFGVLQILDGNILVPVLFSGAVSLHPVAIIVAVLVFGGLFGFWGVFFAIPLASLVKAVIDAFSQTQLRAVK